MGVSTSEVGYTIATTRRETTKVHKNMWWHWGGGIFIGMKTYAFAVPLKIAIYHDFIFVSEMGIKIL